MPKGCGQCVYLGSVFILIIQQGAAIVSVLLGYGRFGSLFYSYFRSAFGLKVIDPFINQATEIEPAAAEDCRNAQYVFFAVPISAIEQTAKEYKQFIGPQTILVDLCSVKEYPLSVLKELFPENEIVGTHPLFGPDSAAESLEGRQIVLCRTGNDTLGYRYLETTFRASALATISMSPEEHDRQMAWTLCLTQFIGRGLANLPLPQNGIGTKGYFDLLDIVTRANRDTRQLFIDMNKYNRFAHEMRTLAVEGFNNLEQQLEPLM